jgi:2-keto-4-pentenoate hydratase/2-oxohepta-3-ene-1,7-dioic acid hydratase in catechol pathway
MLGWTAPLLSLLRVISGAAPHHDPYSSSPDMTGCVDLGLDDTALRGPFPVRTLLDGTLRQDSSTAELIFDIPELVATISRYATLRPGDVIFTGTPAGVGLSTGTFLRPGQTVKVTIPGIGTLTNPVHRFAR